VISRDLDTEKAVRHAAVPRSTLSGVGAPQGADVPFTAIRDRAVPGSFQKGGKLKKTGWTKVHKGERIIPSRAPRTLSVRSKKRRKAKRRKPLPSLSRSAKPNDTGLRVHHKRIPLRDVFPANNAAIIPCRRGRLCRLD
jgi:hypothetical protein